MKLHKSSCTFFAALALADCGDSDSTSTVAPIPDLLLTASQEGWKASSAKGAADLSLSTATTKALTLSAVKVMY